MSPGPDRKIVPLDALAQQVRDLRAAGKTIVQCHGCFDIVHPGHIRYLQFARQLGDVLLVSLTGDSLVGKGPARPYIPQELRAENLAALEFVGLVVVDPHPTACEILEIVRPDVYVKGREYAGSSDPRFRRESEIVQSCGGRVVFHSGDVVFSSTRLIQSLEQDEHLDQVRMRTLCERNGLDRQTVAAALDDFSTQQALVIGDAIRERYVLCDPADSASDAPMMAVQALEVREFWGGAAAVAMQLAALEVPTQFVTCAAEGPARERLLADLTAAGVDTRIIQTETELPKQTTFVADDAKVFRVTQGARCPLDLQREAVTLAVLRERLSPGCTAVWCDYGYGAISPALVSAAEGLPTRARIAAAPADGGEWLNFRGFDLLVLTERRMREALHDPGNGLPAVAWRMLEATGAAAALVSLHKRGLVCFSGRDDAGRMPERLRSEYVPAITSQWWDRLGVQEAIIAAAAATVTNLPLAGYLASAIEGLVASKSGRATVSLSELRRWLDFRPELRPDSRFLPDVATIGDIALIAPPLADIRT